MKEDVKEGCCSHRIFTEHDQVLFSRLSGDANPIHMDPLIARRLMFGQRIVHGIHLNYGQHIHQFDRKAL